VQEGDVIVSLNGKKVTESHSLQLSVAEMSPGTKVTLGILQAQPGQKPAERQVAVTLGELPAEKETTQANPPNERGETNEDMLEGVQVTDIDPAARQQFDIPNNIRGALVVNVSPGSNAAEAGLQPGDVIVGINRQPVRNAAEAAQLSRRSNGPRVLLRVWSKGAGGEGGTHYVVIENTKKTSE
jgi:serine protease Do